MFIVRPGDDAGRKNPNNLPAAATRLVGREQDINAVRELISADSVRLLTMVGPGGVGKTRLALQVAAEMLGSFDDGIFFVELASIVEPEQVTQTITGILQIREAGGASLIATLKEYLQGKKIMLVLDNFEQVVAAGSIVSELLSTCRDLKIIVTSRSPLRLRSEHLYNVSPLDLPAHGDVADLNRLSQYGGIALFTERARAINHEFELTNSNVAAVSEICRKVDGLPLGIELVAAYASLLTPQSLLARLTRPLRLLTSSALDAPERHQTMRDTIEWSYNLLTESEQRLFRHLGTFVGGFTLSAAEAVCNADHNISIPSDDVQALQVLLGVKSLADRNLLRRLQPEEDEDSRLTMLETVREYANEQLTAGGEVDIVRKMHAAYFLSLAEMAKPGPMNQEGLVWLDKLKPEQDNFRSAQSWFMEGKEDGADVKFLRLLQALQHYWERRTQPSEFLGWLEQGLAQAKPDNPLRIWARKRGSIQGINMGDFELAQAWAEHALKIAVEADDRWQITESRSLLASVMASRNDYVAAAALWEQSLVVYREMGKDFQIGSILSNLAAAAIFRGDYNSAEIIGREGLDIFRKLGSKPGIVWSCINLGDALRYMEKLEASETMLLEAVALAQEIESEMMAANALVSLGALSLEKSKSAKSGASQQLGKAARICGLATGLLDRSGTSLEARNRVEFEGTKAAVRAQLTEVAFATAWEQGYKGNIDQAWEIATQEPELEGSATQSGGIGHAKKTTPGGLTARELEVASLVAQGLTNADVARQLILSERTVEMHISNALHKLGFVRRSELTSWINDMKPPDPD